VSVELHLELNNLHANDLLHRTRKLVDFYRCLPDVEASKLKKFAAGMAGIWKNLCLLATIFKNEVCEVNT
jgi:hypothetical protein